MMNPYLQKKNALLAAALLIASVSAVLAGVGGLVEAHDTNAHRIWAPSGSSRVVVDGDGDTDLDCSVYDRFDKLLGFDYDGTDYCVVNITQRTSGYIRIEIENLGDVWNRYHLDLRQ